MMMEDAMTSKTTTNAPTNGKANGSKAKSAKPTPNPMDPASKLGFRPGTKTHTAAMLFLRENGATMAEIVEACGGPQRNLLTAVERKGHKVEKFTTQAKDGKKATAYRIELVESAG